MSRRSLLADAFEHHVWATLRLIDACEVLTPDQLATTVPGTYGSIIDTLRHLVAGDCSYLAVLTGGRRASVADEATLDVAAMRSEMEANGRFWSELLATDPDPTVEVARHRDDGSTSIVPMGVRLAQAIHHGTDHRSQICTALTALGLTPPAIDVWDWADAEGLTRQTDPSG